MSQRTNVSNVGIDPVLQTFEIDDSTITYSATAVGGSAAVGLAVTLSAADTVALAADAEFVLGKLIQVESDGKCVVQTGGVMELPGGTSATLTLGTPIVGDLLVAAKGYIRSAASGQAAELLVARGHIQNAAVTTAVVVNL